MVHSSLSVRNRQHFGKVQISIKYETARDLSWSTGRKLRTTKQMIADGHLVPKSEHVKNNCSEELR